ncbi:unnamed protein product [Echinostoma caproni]|uniref:MSP domain-containing protein n=1 Tax=Echinostoma caproni TaxID=27848 RepID=A0A183ABV6_9TREM|nr:unnamed protein product [Echinostoma caproni]
MFGIICRTNEETVLTKDQIKTKPAWLNTGCKKTITGAIVAHIADTGHQPDNDAFEVTYKVPRDRSKYVLKRHLATAKSVAINIMIPPQYTQKKMVVAFQLPGPNQTYVMIRTVTLVTW